MNKFLKAGFGISIIAVLIFAFFTYFKKPISSIYFPPIGQESTIDQFESDINLPDKSEEAMVYEISNVDDSENYIKNLAKKFNIAGEIHYSEIEDGKLAVINDGKNSFEYHLNSGTWSFSQLSPHYSAPEEPNILPSEEETLSIATEYIKDLTIKNQLVLADVQTVTSNFSGGDLGKSVIEIPEYINVYYDRKINGKDVLGVSRVVLQIGHKGQIRNMFMLARDFKQYKKYTLKSPLKAYKDVQKGQGELYFDGKAAIGKIKKYEIAYYELPGPKLQKELQPIYVFEGDAIDKEGNIKKFEVLVEAVEQQ